MTELSAPETFESLLGSEDRHRSTDDVLAAALPLLRQVVEAHEKGLVAPLEGVAGLHLLNGRLWFENARCLAPRRALEKVDALQRDETPALNVVARTRTVDDSGTSSQQDLFIGERGAVLTRLVYLPGYVSWEHELGHHDPVTDIYVLGLILASLASDLDLTGKDALSRFVLARHDVAGLNPRLHPVVARAIERMTELDRRKRPQDLRSVVETLEHYRTQELRPELDLKEIAGLVARTHASRRSVISERLRGRLFDLSRRNRLLHFHPSGQSLDLTETSVPLVLDVRNLSPDALFTCRPQLVAQLGKLEPIALGSYLRFEDYPFVPASLDKIRTTATRARAEYGFSSLKLAICFLHWHDLKNAREERIHSPLLLVPVELQKKKGVRDSYVLVSTSEHAEVNPVLRHVLGQLYGIRLPEAVDLCEPGALDALLETLTAQVRASEPAVVIDKLDRPSIELIHARVRRRLDAFRKRTQLSGRGVKARDGIDYSYRTDNFQPLGLRLFTLRVAPSESPAATIFDAPRPRMPAMAEPGVREIEKELFSLKKAGDAGGPFRWGFDLTCVTLANFDYQKMSLVQDYETLLDEQRENRAFDALFSSEARPMLEPVEPLPLEQQFPVVPADATQTATIARSRTAKSFIIQGPPGTGKSQTITNLIADYVARGKRVLFVCEKRAAIDVVFHRLGQLGLDRVTSLIHDSQADKKEFVASLKESYEVWMAPGEPSAAVREREETLAAFATPLQTLHRLDRLMTLAPEGSAQSLVQLLRRTVGLEKSRVVLTATQLECLPRHAEWLASQACLEHLTRVLVSLGEPPVLALHPGRLLNDRVLAADRPIALVSETLGRVLPLIERLDSGSSLALAATFERASFAALVRPLAQAGLLALLEQSTELYRSFRQRFAALAEKVRLVTEAVAAAAPWKTPISRTELASVFELARKWHGKAWRFLFPSFWQLRRIIRERFDFTRLLVAPEYVDALAQLKARYDAEDALEAGKRVAAAELGVTDLDGTQQLVESLHARTEWTAAERELRNELLAPGAAQWAEKLAMQAPHLEQLRGELDAVFDGYGTLTLEDMRTQLKGLQAKLGGIPDLAGALRQLRQGWPGVASALQVLPLEPEAFEWAVCDKAASAALRTDPAAAAVTGRALGPLHQQLVSGHAAWRKANAAFILEKARSNFLEHVQRAASSAAGLSIEEKNFKRDYSTGRRELEHETGKVMRFKSIRELMTGKTGLVIRDLKPVWLMSPLSVADTLPLSSDYFDVVIFDEASQIPLEDAIPAIHRAEQTIIVGDEMQLPPTNFFGSAQEEDDRAVTFEEQEAVVSYELDADSLLAHSARTLPSTMLGWHYRSRDEALIQFSNCAFYEGKLATIPTPTRVSPRAAIRASKAEQGADGALRLLERSISYHRLDGATYDSRTNRLEADYIAQMVRGVLAADTGQSLGVVAFSEAQQGEIETALERLALEDSQFRTRLDAEYERTEDDQFCGLFVKNLENVQGDERDIIILSICYGPDTHGRMRMNFGPINKRGGEKRLNVIFSRARRHLAVVSSIDDVHITNDYNDGANTLRSYLRYAAALSRGDAADAAGALRKVSHGGEVAAKQAPRDAAVKALAVALRARGLVVDEAVGGSRFRCELAVRRAMDTQHRLAVLVDTDAYYGSGDADERYRVKPGLLNAFGWKVETVLAKDWREDPGEVVARIEAALEAGR